MSLKSISFQQAAWKRLLKNKGAVIGLFIIVIAILMAVFAYFISPDPSPYANRIILEIGGKKPGYKQTFIKIKKEKNIRPTGIFSQLLNGKEDEYYYVPITSYITNSDSIVIQKFIDDGLTERQAYHKNKAAPQPIITQKFLLGTDKFGHDILSRLIIGVRVSLGV